MGDRPGLWTSSSSPGAETRCRSWVERGGRTIQALSRNQRLGSPSTVRLANVEKVTPASGSKRSTARIMASSGSAGGPPREPHGSGTASRSGPRRGGALPPARCGCGGSLCAGTHEIGREARRPIRPSLRSLLAASRLLPEPERPAASDPPPGRSGRPPAPAVRRRRGVRPPPMSLHRDPAVDGQARIAHREADLELGPLGGILDEQRAEARPRPPARHRCPGR